MKNKLKASALSIAIMTSLTSYAEDKSSINNAVETITVVAPKSNSIKISSKQLVTLPGTSNDPIKGLEALPGVILATPNSGGPISEPAIRGSSRKDNLYLTDGLEMGYVFHNDGLSVYNPLLIESFELKTGAWSPKYTSADGGVIITQLRDASLGETSTIVDLGLYRSGFLHEQAVTENAAFYLSFRESLVHTYIENFIEDEDFSFATPPRNRDYQAKLNWYISETDKLTISANGAIDYLEIAFDEDGRDIAKNPDLSSGEKYQEYYHSQSIDWQRTGDNTDYQFNLNHLLSNQQEIEGDIFRWNADISQWIIKTDNIHYASDYDLQFGAQFKRINIDSNSSGRLLPCNTEFEICPPSYFSDVFNETNRFSINEYNAYLNLLGNLNEYVDYQLGLASIGSDLNNEHYFEPRASLGWQLNENNKLRFAYGLHHTWVDDYRLLSEISGNKALEATRSEHYTLSYNYRFSDTWQARLETYYKRFDNLAVANPKAQKTTPNQIIPNNAKQYLDVASGDAYGVEILINKAFTDNWSGWVSLAYSQTERYNPLTKETFNSEFDLPLVANIVLDYKLSEQWNFSAKWRFQSGRRYTEVLSATPYTEDTKKEPLFYIPQYGDFNGRSVSNYHRLDLRVDYISLWLEKEINLYFELLNAYGSKTIQEFEYSEDYSSFEKDYQFPDMPLPSVGITIKF